MEHEKKILKGTTTIGVTCSDGVLLATDNRASWGTLIASKRAKKVYNINDQVAITVAGSVGDAEALIRLIQAESALYEMNNKEKMSTNAVATLLANILQGSKYYPYMVQLLVGGMDRKSHVYSLDPIGGVTEETMASTGSGSPMAYGILEMEYSEDKTIAENFPIVLKAISAAMGRDTATGDGIDVISITSAGYREYPDAEIEEQLKKIKKKPKSNN